MFTNGVEWAGARLGLSEAAVGSPLAAVGTALPETIVPAVALVISRGNLGPQSEVGVGAIVGAPLMLSTSALFVMAIAALAFRGKRCTTALRLPRSDAHRNLAFFLPPFVSALRIPSRVRAKVSTFRGSTGLPRRIHSKYNPYSIFVSGRSSPAQDYTRRCYVSYADFFQWVTLTASRSIAASRARCRVWESPDGRSVWSHLRSSTAIFAPSNSSHGPTNCAN
jgi:hypothetical protein